MQSDEYKLWFNKADNNLKWASDNLIDGNYALVCFLSQQAAELILKGYLYLKETIPAKTHNLVNLSEICVRQGLELSNEMIKYLNVLTDYYFESRYPDMLDINLNNEKVAKDALESARKIVKKVKASIH
ncbi:hypothetical protein A3A50_01270 [Candidatus Woesebacteria bacterium RIFCSPLOWO2_01_FULL_38_20]|nr:MAG: hypothetical protein A3A50_01270 [Candidatus Woesebacteria bacterium RIFCSPLOWO2_01_FULL_38_20]